MLSIVLGGCCCIARAFFLSLLPAPHVRTGLRLKVNMHRSARDRTRSSSHLTFPSCGRTAGCRRGRRRRKSTLALAVALLGCRGNSLRQASRPPETTSKFVWAGQPVLSYVFGASCFKNPRASSRMCPNNNVRIIVGVGFRCRRRRVAYPLSSSEASSRATALAPRWIPRRYFIRCGCDAFRGRAAWHAPALSPGQPRTPENLQLSGRLIPQSYGEPLQQVTTI